MFSLHASKLVEQNVIDSEYLKLIVALMMRPMQILRLFRRII